MVKFPCPILRSLQIRKKHTHLTKTQLLQAACRFQLLSGTDLPHCETVENMEWHDGYGGGAVTFTGVVFVSNTRRHAANRFAGFDRTGFCLSSPDSQSGMYHWFSEKVA